MNPFVSPASADPLPRAFLDGLADAVLVFDGSGRLQFANAAALRQLPCEAGMVLADMAGVLGADVGNWLGTCLAHGEAQPLLGADGRQAAHSPVLSRWGERHWALSITPQDPLLHRPQVLPVLEIGDAALRGLHDMLWASPFPVVLQDEAFRLIDVNPAFADLVGCSREELIGRDPLELTPAQDRPVALQDRERLQRDPMDPHVPALQEQRLVDRRGQLRWVRSARYLTLTQDRRRLQMVVMQETTVEHAAREQAERFSRELDQWFDLSPLGMALFDEDGLVLRANQAFESMVGGALVDLREASPAVRQLLHWADGRMGLALEPGGAWVASDGSLPGAGGPPRWVRVLLRGGEARGGQRRIMCMLEDRTAEEERDMARLQLGTLVDTAGVGLATLRGPETSDGGAAAAGPPGSVLQASVRRELVVPASLPEFERLQRALKTGERCEARYAILHPELGLRWLLTRIEPGRLASGRPTTSVVTRDITDQQQAQERAEQLLAELSTILESSPAGIASMRGYTLMHCNRRFERMLRLGAGAGVGSDIRALLATRTSAIVATHALDDTLEHGVLYEAELEVAGEGAPTQWYALTIRRTGSTGDPPQAIAVLSEITRLKTQQVQLEALAHEREQMAQVLGQQADRTRAVLDSVLVGIVTVNDAGVISWLNRSARRMFGGDLGDFLGQPIDAVATRDEYHPFRHSLELFDELRDGEAVKFECRVQGRDGRTFWVVGNAVATMGLDGTRELTYALMDIEQRRQAEARIAEARASLQRIIEAAPMAITLFDAVTFEVRQINRVAAQLCGCAAEAAVGCPPEQLYAGPVAQRLREDLRAALVTPDVVTLREYQTQRDEGDPQIWESRFLPLSKAGERVDQVLLVASDVTAQRAAQRAELAAAIAQREMLVQEVHHRIKNNLQGVAGLLQQVGQRRPEVQPVMAEVVGQVQAIAQVYGLQVGAVGPLSVRSVVEAIAQSVQRTFGQTIDLRVVAAPDESPVDWTLPEAESIPIALVLNELLTNAIKHGRRDGEVSCRLVGESCGVRVEIGNVGVLPPGFRIEHRPATVSGLGLVRALLPRRNASLGISQQGNRVVAVVSLAAPVVARPVTPGQAFSAPAGRSAADAATIGAQDATAQSTAVLSSAAGATAAVPAQVLALAPADPASTTA